MRQSYIEQCFPLLRDFLGYMEVVKGRSVNTVEEYFIDLRTFFRTIKKLGGIVPQDTEMDNIKIDDIDIELIRSITLQDVYQYLNYAKNDRENHARSLARKCCSLRVFFRHLTNYTHQLDVNPVLNLDTPKAKKSLPKYLTLEQSISLLQSADGEYAQRDFCMMTLLLNCGLRRAEIVGLNLNDIRSDGTLRVLGKGNKERIVYLNEACRAALDTYLPTRPVDGVEKKHRNALFYSRLKRRLSLQGVHYIIKGYLGRIEGLEDYSTHKLRHTAATLMYRNGVDIRVLKEILGHENLGTTEIYTHLSSEQLEKAADSNPLAHIHPLKKANTNLK
ncbi:MAG: tyrosine recombinase XerC [Oscillospiraceae bacterium]|nr:tyrosine recombinase XerC [Oscillospiraceae bacterium]MDD3832752.1 tyrosine recombinase XerC [Oscillospiraceae bacterium]